MQTDFYGIWGMHRGGTSLLAAAMKAFGASTCGKSLPADRYNPRGYFETMELIALNESMLRELGLRWYSLGYIGHEQIEALLKAGFLNKATTFLQKQAVHSTAVLLKDPRMTRLGSLWDMAFDAVGLKPRCVIVWREPQAVAQSLRRRAESIKFPTPVSDPRYSMLLWLAYMLDALIHTAPWPRALVKYEDFIADPANSLAAIAKNLDVPVSQVSLADCAREVVDKNLDHHSAQAATPLLPRVDAMIELLSSLPGCKCPDLSEKSWEPSPEEKLMAALLDEGNHKIRENAARMSSIHAEISILSGECKALAREIAYLKSKD